MLSLGEATLTSKKESRALTRAADELGDTTVRTFISDDVLDIRYHLENTGLHLCEEPFPMIPDSWFIE